MALTAAEQAEMDQLNQEVGHLLPSQPKGLTPQEHAEMQSLEQEVGHLAPQTSTAQPVAAQAQDRMADAGLQGFGQGGTLGYLPELQAGFGHAIESANEALGGDEATPYADLRAHFQKRNDALAAANPKTTFAGNVAGAVATLPVGGPMAKGASTAAKVGRAALIGGAYGAAANPGGEDLIDNPVENLKARAINMGIGSAGGAALEGAGNAMFKSGLKKIDAKVIEKGAKPFSEVALENGMSGTTKQIANQAEKLLNDTKAARDGLYQKAAEVGAIFDPQRAFKEALDEAVRMGEADPVGMGKISKDLQKKLTEYMEHGPVNAEQASEWKTNLYNSMPESAYNKFGKLKGPVQKIQKMAANGIKNEIEGAANSAAPGLGDAIADTNETMQTLLSARKPLQTQARNAKSINALTSVDAMLGTGAAAASHDPLVTAGVMAAKKAADISKTTAARTIGGRTLMGAGGMTSFAPAASPWLMMNQGGQ